ncbi:MAG: pilus assembly protein PilP [Myxococcota bacterium]
MRRAAAFTLTLLVALAGCGDEPPTGPTTADLKAERAALAEKMKNQDSRAQQANVMAAETGSAEEKTEFGGAGADYVYDSTGKRDPFRSFRWEREQEVADEGTLGPLEQFELEQLDVTAVIWSTHRPRALVEDPSGRSYIVHEGTRIGKNDGLVIHIGDNLVLVKETYVDFAGEQTTKDVELRIRRSQGG